MRFNYKELEDGVRTLLTKMTSFTPLEIAEVEQFLDVGEYGLAFEAFCGIVSEENKIVPIEIRPTIRMLAERMEIDSDFWIEIVDE